MALYCSREIMESLDGVPFPATKDDLLDYVELKDAMEAVVVALNRLDENTIYNEISEVCENARIACDHEIVGALSRAPFPATRDDLIEFIDRYGAPDGVKDAVLALPSGYTFENLDEMCGYVL